jgi:hypothetical protein
MRRWLVVVLFLLAWTLPSTAHAKSNIQLEQVNVELWAEYDQPSMLVIYEFVVSQETPLPATVTVRYPIEGNLVAVAVEQDGQLFNKEFTTPVKQGDWQTLTMTVEAYTPHRIEYYQQLTLDGNKRQFQYNWLGDYDVQEFLVGVLIPPDSTDLNTSPPLEEVETTANGYLTTGILRRSDLKMMHSFQLDIEYQRNSTALVSPNPSTQVEPLAPVGEDTPGRISIAQLPWIIGGFGLALIGIALLSYWRSTQSSESQPRKRKRHKAQEEGTQAYCHECGARAHPGDRFCRTCGSRLRTE